MDLKTVIAKYKIEASNEAVAQDWLLDNEFDILVTNIRDINSTRMPGYNEAVQVAEDSRFGFVIKYLKEVSISKFVNAVTQWVVRAKLPRSNDVIGPFKNEYGDGESVYMVFDVWGKEITVQVSVNRTRSLGAHRVEYIIMMRSGNLGHQNFVTGPWIARDISHAIEEHVRSNPPRGFRLMRVDPNNQDVTTDEGRAEYLLSSEKIRWTFSGQSIHFHA